jgi:hypothetical protein
MAAATEPTTCSMLSSATSRTKSLENEVAEETKINKDPKHLIEVRIRLLKTLASHNTASHCK